MLNFVSLFLSFLIFLFFQPIPPPPPTLAQSSSNIPPPPPIPAVLEASAYREMPLTRSPDVGLVSFSGLTEPCSVGSIVEVVVSVVHKFLKFVKSFLCCDRKLNHLAQISTKLKKNRI